MAKMTVSIVVFALSIYVANFVHLGDYTLREHMVRIGKTSEVHELGEGIVSRLSATKSAVKTRVAARLHREQPED